MGDGIGRLIVTTWSGGSADRIILYSLDGDGIRKVLEESFKIDATFINVDGLNDIRPIIITTEGDGDQTYMIVYSWSGKEFKESKRIPLKSIKSFISENIPRRLDTDPRRNTIRRPG